jgi:hypothetical protein
MKKFLIIIFINLFFLAIVKANEINDFQIEEISIGESLLNFFSKNVIKKKQNFIYFKKDKNYSKDIAVIQYLKDLKTYDQIQISFKVNEPNLPIVGISAWILYEGNFNACYKKQDEIFNDLKDYFGNIRTRKEDMADHPGYPKGEVRFKRYSFYFPKAKSSNLEVICITSKNYKDRLSVTIKSDEYNEFLTKLHR